MAREQEHRVTATGSDDADRGVRRSRRRGIVASLARVSLALVLAWVGLMAVGCMLQERLIFPSHFAGRPSGETPPGVEQRWVLHRETAYPTARKPDARTEWWFVPGRGRSDESPGPAVLYFHGNGEILEEIHPSRWAVYTDRGVSVALMEYRGYGNADGRPGQKRVLADALAMRDAVLGLPEVDGSRLVYHGRSLGGGVAAQLAKREAPAGLVLETTFTSINAMARRYLMPSFLVRHPFRTDVVLEQHYEGPVLIVHGDEDVVVPVSHGRRLAAIAPDRTTYVEFRGDGHNDFPRDFRTYEQVVETWLNDVGLLPNGGDGATEQPRRSATDR